MASVTDRPRAVVPETTPGTAPGPSTPTGPKDPCGSTPARPDSPTTPQAGLHGLRPPQTGLHTPHVQIVDEASPEIEIKGHIGVDLGVKNLATTADGEHFSGDDVEKRRRRYGRRRKGLNMCGTKDARRRLRKIRRRESEFRRHENHKIANKIIAKAKDTGCAIGLEDLQGIRDRATARGPEQRSCLYGWAFHQLKTFIAYKAQREGIPIVPVDPRNTSRTCSVCGYCDKRNRKTRDHFVCRRCGYTSCADVNAARNIKLRAAVNRPMAGVDDTGPRNPVETACKLRGFSPSSS